MTALPADFALGTELADGRYRILGFLGAGAMGAVYEAENTLTGKTVALKCVRLSVDPNDSAAERLLQEARFAARIRHPNVVDVYDVIRGQGHLALVMERLYGEPLAARMRGERLSVEQALAYLLPVMRGVAAAHRKGVIHRDIKPENIFLAHEEDALEPVPKLLDFGIAKVGLRQLEESQLTRSGQIIGTPLYMALEQFTGERDLDGRTDIYALGVVLYEALTGRTPFAAPTLPTLIYKITQTDPDPPHVCCADIPPALSAIIVRALARDRAERPASVEALIRELEPFAGRNASQPLLPDDTSRALRSEPSHEASSRSARTTAMAKRPVLWISLAVVACLGAAALALFPSSTEGPAQAPAVVRASVPVEQAATASVRAPDALEGDASSATPDREAAEAPKAVGADVPATSPTREPPRQSARPRSARRALASNVTRADAAVSAASPAPPSVARDTQVLRADTPASEPARSLGQAPSQLRIPIPPPEEF